MCDVIFCLWQRNLVKNDNYYSSQESQSGSREWGWWSDDGRHSEGDGGSELGYGLLHHPDLPQLYLRELLRHTTLHQGSGSKGMPNFIAQCW